MPQSKPTKLKKTMRRWTGTKLKLMMEAIGQILYPATMMGIVSYNQVSASSLNDHLAFL